MALRYWWILGFGSGIFILLLVALFIVLSLYQALRDAEVPDHDDVELLVSQHTLRSLVLG